MKDRIIGILMGFMMISFLLILLIIAGYSDTHYSTTAEVLSTNEDIVMVDGAGYVWAVTDRPDLHKGDYVKIKFFNNTTDYTREDDEILDVILLDR